jgi:hypothetical protein
MDETLIEELCRRREWRLATTRAQSAQLRRQSDQVRHHLTATLVHLEHVQEEIARQFSAQETVRYRIATLRETALLGHVPEMPVRYRRDSGPAVLICRDDDPIVEQARAARKQAAAIAARAVRATQRAAGLRHAMSQVRRNVTQCLDSCPRGPRRPPDC